LATHSQSFYKAAITWVYRFYYHIHNMYILFIIHHFGGKLKQKDTAVNLYPGSGDDLWWPRQGSTERALW
jgi:hypothetical protein